MNQILSTNGPKKNDPNEINELQRFRERQDLLQKQKDENKVKKERPKKEKVKKEKTLSVEAQTKSIIKYFAIFMLIFGILNTSFGSYVIAKDIKEKTLGPEIPQISVSETQLTGKTLDINVISRTPLDSFTYSWDSDKIQTIQTDDANLVSQAILVPNGKHVLHVIVKNVDGYSSSEDFLIQRDADIKINVKQNGVQIQVDVESKNNLESVSYKWNNDNETTEEVDDTYYSFKINVPLGSNELTIIATDENGQEETIKTTVIGTIDVEDNGKGPELELSATDTEFIIEGKSDIGIKLVEYYVNNSRFSQDDYPNGKSYKETLDSDDYYYRKFKLLNGYNKLTIRIFDDDDNVTIKTIEKTLDLSNDDE